MGRPGLGMLRAAHWKDIATYTPWQNPGGARIRGEDPMLWYETRATASRDAAQRESAAEVLHAVTHGGGWGQPYGYHYWSLDGGYTWKESGDGDVKVYENTVNVAGGGVAKILSRRERPHVVLGKGGKPIAVTNGVTEAWPCTLQQEPDRPPCKHPTPPGTNPDCGPGSNGTAIWCPVDYCYTLFQPLYQH